MSVKPAEWRKPRRTGLPRYLWVVTFEDGSRGWYWPESDDVAHLLRDSDVRDDYEIRIVWWNTDCTENGGKRTDVRETENRN